MQPSARNGRRRVASNFFDDPRLPRSHTCSPLTSPHLTSPPRDASSASAQTRLLMGKGRKSAGTLPPPPPPDVREPAAAPAPASPAPTGKQSKRDKRHADSDRSSKPPKSSRSSTTHASPKAHKNQGKPPSSAGRSGGNKSSAKASHALLPSVPLTPGQVSLMAPVWSHDSTLLLFPRSSGVRIMVRSTNRTAGVLPAPPGSGAVVAVALHPRNMARVLALTSSWALLEFDYLDPQLLRTTQLASDSKASVAALVPALVSCPDETQETPYAFVATSRGRILAVDLSAAGRRPHLVRELAHLPDTIKAMRISSDNRCLVVAGAQGLYLAKASAALAAATEQRPTRTWIQVLTKYPTTALAVPSVTSTLATGDDNGVVRLWPALLTPAALDRLAQQGKPLNQKSGLLVQAGTYVASTAMHWHPHPVRALAFARRDAVVLSGGEESTLVVWQVGVSSGGGGNETKKEFAPRLPAFISDIAPVPPPPVAAAGPATGAGGARRAPAQANESAGLYAVTCSDGSTVVLNAATLRMEQIYAPEGARAIDPALAANQPTASLGIPLAVSGNLALLPGPRPASVQVVDPSMDQHLLTLETAPDNRVGAMDDSPPEPVRPRVAALSQPSPAALASSSSVWTKASLPPWLATVESRLAAIRSDGTLVEQEQALVLWHARASATGYTLASRIERPHQGTVTGAAFAPAPNGPAVDPRPRLATASADGSVRLWSLASRPSARGAVRSWRLAAALTFRTAQPSTMAWDASGEVLAVGWSYNPKLSTPSTSKSTSGDMPWGAVTLIDASPSALASGSAGILRTFPLGTMGVQSVARLAWTSSTSVVRTLIATSSSVVAALDVVDGVCLARGAIDNPKHRRIIDLLPPRQPSSSLVGWVVTCSGADSRSGSGSGSGSSGSAKAIKGTTTELVSLSLHAAKPGTCGSIKMARVGVLPPLRTVLSLPIPAESPSPSQSQSNATRAHTVLLGLTLDLDALAFGTAPLPPASRVLHQSSQSPGQPSLWAQLVGPPPEPDTAPAAAAAPARTVAGAGAGASASASQTDVHAGLALLRSFDAPAHLLPSVGSLLLSVQKALLPPAPAVAADPADRSAEAGRGARLGFSESGTKEAGGGGGDGDHDDDEDGDTAFTDAAAPPSSEAQGGSSASVSFATAAPASAPSFAPTAKDERAQAVQVALGARGLAAITSALESVVLENRKGVSVVPDAVSARAGPEATRAASATATATATATANSAAAAQGTADALAPPASTTGAADLSISSATSTGRLSKSNARKRKARQSQ